MFGFGKKKAREIPEVVIPVPTAQHYVLSAEEQEALSSLQSDADGFVNIGDVTHGLFHQQPQYISRFMDGSVEGRPVLVDGLRVDVASISYHEYRIHKDDVVEFVARVRAWRGQ